MDETQKLKETIDELSLQIIQADAVIRRLTSAAKYLLGRHSLYDWEQKEIFISILSGEGYLGYEVPADELVENYRKIEH